MSAPLTCDRIVVLEREDGGATRRYPVPAGLETPDMVLMDGARWWRVDVLTADSTEAKGTDA